MLDKIHCTETCSLRTEYRATPGHTLSGKHSCIILLSELLVHTIHETDFTAAYSDITSRNILIRSYDFPEFKHECLTETHDLRIRLSTWVEIRSALAATHWKGCKSILEGLLETEELQNRKIHRRMETKTTLVRSDCRIELNTITGICLNLTVIIHPCHLESKNTLRLYDALYNLRIFKLRMLVVNFFN